MSFSSLYHIGYCNKNVKKGSVWKGNASNKFKAWFYEYEHKWKNRIKVVKNGSEEIKKFQRTYSVAKSL